MIYRCEECGDDFLTEADSYVVKQTHSGVNLYCSCQIKNKENAMSEWITDRRPTEEDACKDADPVLYECVIVQGRDYKLFRKWYNVTSGEAWQCIPWENADEPIAKAKRSAAMSEWITDRRPIEHDEPYVYDSFGHVCHWIKIANGEPWKPIPKCEPYVKPKRYKVVQLDNAEWAILRIADDKYVAHSIIWNAREAAERIAAIYEEMMS